jgi:hypothetical protein
VDEACGLGGVVRSVAPSGWRSVERIAKAARAVMCVVIDITAEVEMCDAASVTQSAD